MFDAKLAYSTLGYICRVIRYATNLAKTFFFVKKIITWKMFGFNTNPPPPPPRFIAVFNTLPSALSDTHMFHMLSNLR
jgi:hypothetical protein